MVSREQGLARLVQQHTMTKGVARGVNYLQVLPKNVPGSLTLELDLTLAAMPTQIVAIMQNLLLHNL